MIDDEKRDAERLAAEMFQPCFSSGERYGFIKGYVAGRESMRKESDANARACAKAIEYLNAERQRVRQLINSITETLRSETSSDWDDLCQKVNDSILNAITEYEAKK